MTQYLIRFDDIYTGMQPEHFEQVCGVIRRARIPAVLGVTPAWEENSFVGEVITAQPTPPGKAEPYTSVPVELFWSTLRELQADGCEMTLHGYCHKLHYCDNYFNINPYGEFAGLPRDEQLFRLQQGQAILRKEGLAARVFMPPAHTIDTNTLWALKQVGINAITDGKTFFPHYIDGVLFIPQITSEIRTFPFGVITICLHPQYMTDSSYIELERFIDANRKNVVSMETVLKSWSREPSWIRTFNRAIFGLYRWRRQLQ